MEEIANKEEPRYTRYAHGVLDTWKITVVEQGNEAFTGEGLKLAKGIDRSQKELTFEGDGFSTNGDPFENLSDEDRRLIREAVRLECDVFLTVEEKLPKSFEYIGRELPIRVLRPYELWEDEIAPHFRPSQFAE